MGIPFEEYGQRGPFLHFGHANGYPPGAYRQLLERLGCEYQVLAMRMRPLWPGADPLQIADFRPFADDLMLFLQQQRLEGLIGAGHSMGASITLRLALSHPELFSCLVLIDPVLFTPGMLRRIRLLSSLGPAYRLHPLIRSTLNRRRFFQSKAAMFENYRRKAVFSRLDDVALWDYVEAIASPLSDGKFELAYSPEWEARLYLTGNRADMEVWRGLKGLKPPALVIRGACSYIFSKAGVLRLKQSLPGAQIETIQDATHLVPLEKPAQVSELMLRFIHTIPVQRTDS